MTGLDIRDAAGHDGASSVRSGIRLSRMVVAKQGTLLLAAALMLGACGVPLARERRYTGRLDGCGLAGPSTLMRMPDSFAFSPGDSSLIIRGAVAPDGSFAGSLNTQPQGRTPYVLSVQGRVTETAAAVTYATPTCRVSGSLAAVPVRLSP
jgi:hypothetical protein